MLRTQMKRKVISFFFIFPSNGAPVEWNWQGKIEVLGWKPVPVPLCPPQIPYGMTRDRTRASAVGGRRLTAWSMARPQSRLTNNVLNNNNNNNKHICNCKEHKIPIQIGFDTTTNTSGVKRLWRTVHVTNNVNNSAWKPTDEGLWHDHP
jgi:hypothetical protein